MLHNTQQRGQPGVREPECGVVVRMDERKTKEKKTIKKMQNSTIKSHTILRYKKGLEENIIPARKAKNTGENLYKTPIYKYKKNHVRASGSYSDAYSEYRLRGIPSICLSLLQNDI